MSVCTGGLVVECYIILLYIVLDNFLLSVDKVQDADGLTRPIIYPAMVENNQYQNRGLSL